jgi:hypothetical protein
MYNIKTLRGTIFCAPIKYSKEFITSLAGVIDGYLPLLVRDNGALPGLPTWQLTSPNEKEILAFNGDKIDLVQVFESEIGDEIIAAFASRCKDVFRRILETTGYVCTRIALAPSVIVAERAEKPIALYNRIFAVRELDGVTLDTSNISQVYRLNKTIGRNEVRINHVSNFHVENELVTMGGINQLRERYIGDFDINTMVNPEYKFSVADVMEFFDLSPSFFVSFYNLYFVD